MTAAIPAAPANSAEAVFRPELARRVAHRSPPSSTMSSLRDCQAPEPGAEPPRVDERQVTRLARDVAAIRGWALRADAGMNRELVKRVSRGRSWNRRPLHVAGTPAAAHVSGRA